MAVIKRQFLEIFRGSFSSQYLNGTIQVIQHFYEARTRSHGVHETALPRIPEKPGTVGIVTAHVGAKQYPSTRGMA